MSNAIPVILRGGVGARLWPLNRKSVSEQFVLRAGNNCLLQPTQERVAVSSTAVACVAAHQFLEVVAMQSLKVQGIVLQGKTDLEPTEVLSGNYLGEDVIVQFEDTYRRAPVNASEAEKFIL
jgi:mannose-1-phosphate guanylyltransferase